MSQSSKRIVGICSTLLLFLLLIGCAAHKVSVRSESEKVLDRYLEASGGRVNLEKVTDTYMEGTVMVMGMTMNFVDQRKNPYLQHARATVGGNTFFERVSNGEKGYTSVQGQKTEVTAEEIAKGWRVGYWPELEYDKRAVKSVLAGTEDINGQQAHKIELQFGEGDNATSWFLVESGLKVKTQSTEAGALQTVTLSDYRDVDGVMLPFSIVINNQMQIEVKAKKFKLNQNLDDAVFKVE